MAELLTLKEVAGMMDVSPQTVRDMVNDGRLNGYNFAGTKRRALWRFRPEEVEAFISNSMVAIDRVQRQFASARAQVVARKKTLNRAIVNNPVKRR